MTRLAYFYFKLLQIRSLLSMNDLLRMGSMVMKVGSILVPVAKILSGLWFLNSSAQLVWKCLKPMSDNIRMSSPRFASGRVGKFYKFTPPRVRRRREREKKVEERKNFRKVLFLIDKADAEYDQRQVNMSMTESKDIDMNQLVGQNFSICSSQCCSGMKEMQSAKMVKLTPDLIEGAGQYINPIRDRELDLRGYKIPVIENLGTTLDQFDTIDFSDNEIRKLDGFPYLMRVKSLLLNNNRIVRLGEGLELCLPNLHTLVLTNNSLQELADLEPITSLKKLTLLSLLHNPVVTKRNYREYVIHKFPNLR